MLNNTSYKLNDCHLIHSLQSLNIDFQIQNKTMLGFAFKGNLS